MFEKAFGTSYMTTGFWEMIELYHLKNGGWLKVWYARGSEFYTRVRDINHKKIQYPNPPVKITFDVKIENVGQVHSAGGPAVIGKGKHVCEFGAGYLPHEEPDVDGNEATEVIILIFVGVNFVN